MQNAPPIMVDDEKAVEQIEGDRRNSEEVHRSDGFPMIAKEGEPTFGWLGIPRSSFHPAGDRSLGKIKPEHEKLAMDARRAPIWILNNHSEDQLPSLLRRLFSPNLRPDFGDQLPIQVESGPVPPNYRFRGDDNEGLLPTGPNSPRNYPEELIEETEGRPWTGTASAWYVAAGERDSRGRDVDGYETREQAL
jgi:hypothetical protein